MFGLSKTVKKIVTGKGQVAVASMKSIMKTLHHRIELHYRLHLALMSASWSGNSESARGAELPVRVASLHFKKLLQPPTMAAPHEGVSA